MGLARDERKGQLPSGGTGGRTSLIFPNIEIAGRGMPHWGSWDLETPHSVMHFGKRHKAHHRL